MRYGTRTHCRRRWSRQGTRPTCRVRLGYEWGYLYVAICPFTGDMFSMLLTHLDKDCFAEFARQLQEHLKEKGVGRALLVGDGPHQSAMAGAPTARVGEATYRLPATEPGGALLRGAAQEHLQQSLGE